MFNTFPASIYRVPLQTPASMAKEIKARASKLDLVMQNVHIKHPLVCHLVELTLARMQERLTRSPDICSSSGASQYYRFSQTSYCHFLFGEQHCRIYRFCRNAPSRTSPVSRANGDCATYSNVRVVHHVTLADVGTSTEWSNIACKLRCALYTIYARILSIFVCYPFYRSCSSFHFSPAAPQPVNLISQ